MADRTIGELPALSTLEDDTLIPVEHDGEAKSMAGTVLQNYLYDRDRSASVITISDNGRIDGTHAGRTLDVTASCTLVISGFFSVGTVIKIINDIAGTGTVTIRPILYTTINGEQTDVIISDRYACVTLTATGQSSWVIEGNYTRQEAT